MPNPTSLPVWPLLRTHYESVRSLHMRDMFAADPGRFAKFSIKLGDFLLDYSKHRITGETMRLLVRLAREAGVEERREAMFKGEAINVTEHRPAAHFALRAPGDGPLIVGGRDVRAEVKAVRARMRHFVQAVHSGGFAGADGRPMKSIVNIGIGGSDLGPALAVEALAPYRRPGLKCHFVSNVDPSHLHQALAECDPATTLFVVASKTFTTQETMANAAAARAWLTGALGEAAVGRHFVALSTNLPAVADFGIAPDNVFAFWDWVGGRFSVWSAIGLSVALAVGDDRFEEFLAGAAEMDAHFRQAPLDANMPVVMALIGLWYIDFFGATDHALLPYDQYLARLPGYLQQLDMESNGKSVTEDGKAVSWQTGPVVFGQAGTNGQHAFYQLLHQGSRIVPADIILAAASANPLGDQHRLLVANALAQAEALMTGRSLAEVRAGLAGQGLTGPDLDRAAAHRVFEGNRPSNLIFYARLDPRTLGRLLALYEHKIFVQGVLWQIDSFDQWGVELGKQLARTIDAELAGGGADGGHDSSTLGLMAHYRSHCR